MENDNILFKSSNGMVEICEMPEDKLGGRVKIKMTAHEIYPNRSIANENGICWLEQYTQDNIDTCIGMPYVVSWLGTKEDGIPSDHGRMDYCDDGSIVFEGDVVGSVQEVYIEDIEIDGVTKKVLMTEGYIYEQRNKAFVDFLREQQTDGDVVYGSVEINGKDGNTDIEYLDGRTNEDGSLKMDRVPTKYCYSGLAILFDTPPADTSSQVIEVNNKINNIDENNKTIKNDSKTELQNESTEINESNNLISNSSENDINKIENNKKGEQTNMNFVKKGQVVEVNNLEVYDIEKMLRKAFLIAIGCFNDSCDYWISYLYPLNSEFVVTKWNDNGDSQYYKTSYSIDTSAKTVTLGDIYEVERSWTPVDNEQPIEMNANKKKEVEKDSTEINEGGNEDMEDKKMIEECNTKISELNTKVTEKDATITELNAKVVELNEAIVNANKTMEELNAKVKTIEEENNACKTEVNNYKEKYDTLIAEKSVAETNSYFETEIKKNGFEEVEVNSLKDFVSKGDLEGLKKAEAELCAKKFKEMISKSDEKAEINSSKGLDNMIAIKEEKLEKSEVEEGKSLFI